MLNRVDSADTGQPGAQNGDEGKAPEPAVDEDDNIGFRISEKTNPILQGPWNFFPRNHTHALVRCQSFTKEIVPEAEYGKLNSRLVDPAQQFKKMSFGTAILVGFRDKLHYFTSMARTCLVRWYRGLDNLAFEGTHKILLMSYISLAWKPREPRKSKRARKAVTA